jgi:hypothetical protein
LKEPKPESLVHDVADALRPIMASGLPISPDYADERLLRLRCVVSRCDDPSSRLSRVKSADEILKEAIAQYPDDKLNHAVSILFGVALGSRRLILGDRRTRAAGDSGYDVDHFRKNIEPKILNELAWIIVRQTLDTALDVEAVARQLYRYAQRALVPLEAFDLCTDYAVRLLVAFAKARLAQEDPEGLPHGWLAKYGNKGEVVQLVPASRTDESDQGLWALAYVSIYLRTLLRDRTGRAAVRESLPPESWESIQRPAFGPDETKKMLSVLEGVHRDRPKTFVDDLCKDVQGRAIHEKWLKLLAAQSVAPSGDEFAALARSEAARDLLMLCLPLQNTFPDETLLAPGEDFEAAVSSIIWQRADELGVSMDGEGADVAGVSKLIDGVLEYSPPRYANEEGREKPEYVWTNNPSLPAVWDDLLVSRAWVIRPESEDPEREPREMWIVPIPGSGLFD